MNDHSLISFVQRESAWRAFRAGASELAIFVPSYLPFGMLCGVAAVQAGLGQIGAVALAAFAFAGSAQAVVTQFLLAGVPLSVAIVSGLVVNLRMAVYSAAISQHLHQSSRSDRMLWAAFLVDQTFLQDQSRRHRNLYLAHPLAFYLGCAATLWPCWIIANALGAFLGARIPAHWQMDFTIPLSLVAIAVPLLKDRALIAAALVGGFAGTLLFFLPLKLGLLLASTLGTSMGLLIDAWATHKVKIKEKN
jgi:predicted branched-subunit amino acid permease